MDSNMTRKGFKQDQNVMRGWVGVGLWAMCTLRITSKYTASVQPFLLHF